MIPVASDVWETAAPTTTRTTFRITADTPEIDMRTCVWYECDDCKSTCASTTLIAHCTCGGKMFRIGTLHNKHLFKKEIACDARCQSASRNSVCECACNGANHARAVYVEVNNGYPIHQPITEERIKEGIMFRSLLGEYVKVVETVRDLNKLDWFKYYAARELVDKARSLKTFDKRKGKLESAIALMKGLL